MKQEVITAGLWIVTVGHTFLQQQSTVQSLFGRSGEGEATVIRLNCPTGNQGISTLRQGVGDQELQLSGFVSPSGKTKKVIPLHVDGWSAKGLG
jgi:hypothetical protein